MKEDTQIKPIDEKTDNATKDNKKKSPVILLRILSTIQIIMGLVTFISKIIYIDCNNNLPITSSRWIMLTTGEGIYVGLIYMVAGTLGWITSYKLSNFTIILLHKVLIFLSFLTALLHIALASIQLHQWNFVVETSGWSVWQRQQFYILQLSTALLYLATIVIGTGHSCK